MEAAARNLMDSIALARTSHTWHVASLASDLFVPDPDLPDRRLRPQLCVAVAISPSDESRPIHAAYICNPWQLDQFLVDAIAAAGGSTPALIQLDENMLRYAGALAVLDIIGAPDDPDVQPNRAQYWGHWLLNHTEVPGLPEPSDLAQLNARLDSALSAIRAAHKMIP